MTEALVSSIAIVYTIALILIVLFVYPRSKILTGLFIIFMGINLSASFDTITNAPAAIVAGINIIWAVGIGIIIWGLFGFIKEVNTNG